MLVTQSCPTLCNPMICRPPGSSVHGISQAFPYPGELPNPGIKPGPPALQADSLPSELIHWIHLKLMIEIIVPGIVQKTQVQCWYKSCTQGSLPHSFNSSDFSTGILLDSHTSLPASYTKCSLGCLHYRMSLSYNEKIRN